MSAQVAIPVAKGAGRDTSGPYTTVLPSAKVCIHTLREFRYDVRAMRAASALTEAGLEVSVVDIEAERTRPTEEEVSGAHVRHVLIPTWYSARCFEPWFFVKALQALVLSVLRLMQTRADIYHASDLTALPASFIAATLRRKPLIFEVYDLQFPVPETGISFWRRLGRLLTRFHAFVLPRCAGVIATSPLHAEEICRRFSICHPERQRRISVHRGRSFADAQDDSADAQDDSADVQDDSAKICIPEVVLLRNIPAYRSVGKSNRLREYLGLGPDVGIALYQGSLQPDRELDRLIRAARFLKRDIVIVMMGKDKVGTQAQLEELIASEGVADRVKILPPVPYEELLDWTASADIGLIIYSSAYSPNVQMCLPNKLFEFLMAGLPVLAGQLDAIASVLRGHDVGQTVSSLEPAAIGEAITAMLEDGDALAHMRGSALKAVQQELNWEKESHKLISLYEEILSRLVDCHPERSEGSLSIVTDPSLRSG